MHLVKLTTLTAIFLLLTACASKHQPARSSGEQTGHRLKLTSADTIAITQPPDGSHGQTIHRGSGALAAKVLFLAFSRHADSVKIGPYAHTADDALPFARQMGQRYLVHPTIILWQDGMSEMSSLKNKVEIKIALIETATGRTMFSDIVSSSGAIEYLHGGPRSLLQQSLEDFVTSLY